MRYAAVSYAAHSSAKGVALTNTFVGKRLLGSGVAPITGTLAELVHALQAERAAQAEQAAQHVGSLSFDGFVAEIRRVVGQLLLSAEPQLRRTYLNR